MTDDHNRKWSKIVQKSNASSDDLFVIYQDQMACCLGHHKIDAFEGGLDSAIQIKEPAPVSENDQELSKMHQDMHGFYLKGSTSEHADYFAWQKPYSQKQSDRAVRWSALMKRSQISPFTPSSELKKLVRKGIPNGLRGQVWMDLSGAAKKLADNQGLYQKHLDGAEVGAHHDVLVQIELDLHRTFPDHPHFSRQRLSLTSIGTDEDGLLETKHMQSLRRVLRAYACRNPGVGYCQGMNFIAGIMLLFLDEERAYWLLATLLETILPVDYYATDLIGCNVDLRVLGDLLAQKLPKVSKALTSSGVGIEFFGLEWFIALFSKTLPSETVLRIWDCIFSEGDKMLFRVALGILSMSEKELVGTLDQHQVLQVAQGLGRGLLDVERLLKTSFGLYLKRDKVQAARTRHRSDVESERQLRMQQNAPT